MSAAIRLGLLRLADSAPVLLAEAEGLFAAEGVSVRLSVEPSWANIADKLSYGALDAASILPPLAIAIASGLRGPARPLIVPMSLGTGGNSVTLAPTLAEAVGEGGSALERARRLRAALDGRKAPRLAVVHGFSTHNLLLRYWLAAGGIDPDRDVEIVTLPPERTAAALQAGAIDGFCAGGPWGEATVDAGAGRRVVGSREIWAGHPEKALAIDAARASAEPDMVQALLRALLRAGRICDEADRSGRLATLLADRDGLALPARATSALLAGPDRPIFAAGAAGMPFLSHAAWFGGQMRRWGWVGPEPLPSLYRPALFRQASLGLGYAAPATEAKIEGSHDGAWRLDATPRPIAMEGDRFCDRQVFDAQGGTLPMI